MTGSHMPTPEFRARLEGEIVGSYRAQRRSDMMHRFRTVTLVVIALTAGAAAGATPALVQEARQRSDLIAAQQAELRIAQMRLDLAAAALEDARNRFSVGVIGREALVAAEGEFKAMEAKLRRLAIDLEEIEASGLPPRDEISAPLVGGRDFVMERLRLALAESQQRLVMAEQVLDDVARRQRVGAGSPMALPEADADLEAARLELRKLTEILDLRQEALRQRLSASESERRVELIQARQDRDNLHNMLELAEQRLETVRTRVSVGADTAGELELKRAEIEVLQRRIELSQAERELQLLEMLAGRPTVPDTSRAR